MLGSIELLRLISVILIVFTHTRHNIDAGIFHFLFEIVPQYGTTILSIISGYLFKEFSSKKSNLLNKKIHTLLIPFLISNLVVIILVFILKIFDFNVLNRLHYDLSIISDGLFALNRAPINPPTFFIRDLFLLFCIISLFQKNYYSLLLIIPYIIFGKLFLRVDIVFLFIIGSLISLKKESVYNNKKIFYLALAIIIIINTYLQNYDYIKFSISILIFLLSFDAKIKFINIGGYSYLLHLYHSPIIVMIYPLLKQVIYNQVLLVFLQFTSTIIITYIMNKILKKYKLYIFTGSRI